MLVLSSTLLTRIVDLTFVCIITCPKCTPIMVERMEDTELQLKVYPYVN